MRSRRNFPVILIACLIGQQFSLFAEESSHSNQAIPSEASSTALLPAWADTATKRQILAFVDQVTTPGTPDYVSPEDRIAVFDNDGCLWTEQPVYTQFAFAFDQIRTKAKDHPEWKTEEPFRSILSGDVAGVKASGMEGVGKVLAQTHAGMTTAEFQQEVSEWIRNTKHPVLKRPYDQCVYQPQIELIELLHRNQFKVFIVSGGGVDFMRPWTERVYGIVPERVVGSMGKLEYQVREGKPVLVKLPEIDFIDDKEGKPVGIQKFIGKRPILAVGNSDGDFAMLEYATMGNTPSLGLLVHHDDADREFAYDRDSSVGKLNRGLDEAEKRGWLLISMKNDWQTIFPPEQTNAPTTP